MDVVVGGTLPALLLAIYHAKAHKDRQVLLIESSTDLGGTNGSMRLKSGELFDHGMRLYYECGIPDLDTIITEALPQNHLNIYADNNKDPAACYFNGKLQNYSPCIDMRFLAEEEKFTAIGQLCSQNLSSNIESFVSAEQYLLNRFGQIICEKGFFPILEGLYKIPVASMHVEASIVHFGMTPRVILFDDEKTLELIKCDFLRSRLAYPNQENLPSPYSKRKGKAIYPKNMGMQNLISALEDYFIKCGGEVLKNTLIQDILIEKANLKHLSIKKMDTGICEVIDVDFVFWGAPLYLLARHLNIITEPLEQAKVKPYLYHFIIDEMPSLRNNYYLFNFHSDYQIFRVANYSAYCPKSYEDGRFKITVEYWSLHDEINITNVWNELINIGVVSEQAKVIDVEAVSQGKGFPHPTIGNFRIIQDMRDRVSGFDIKNLISFGQGAEELTFYVPQILTKAFGHYKKCFKI